MRPAGSPQKIIASIRQVASVSIQRLLDACLNEVKFAPALKLMVEFDRSLTEFLDPPLAVE
ncbi:hypothetical protein CIC12_28990 [Burkholderia sp. SG-MS1]|nr:hypothetical protein [Paraburkholderia sp. SG-MS1]